MTSIYDFSAIESVPLGVYRSKTITEIRNFCTANFDVTFPLFAKIDVNGSDADPLYKFPKRGARGVFGAERIKWNFTKFLVDSQGEVRKRYAPTAKPSRIENAISALL